MKFFKYDFQIKIIDLSNFTEILKIFQILYYKNIGFLDMKFFK